MKYRKGYKYQLAEDEVFQTSLRGYFGVQTKRIQLSAVGVLTVREGYAWDGTSGPVIDRKSNMRGSCGHDALYQLMRMGLLDCRLYETADKDFGRWIKKDGAWPLVVKLDLAGLRLAKGRAALPKNRKKVYEN